MAKSLRSKWKRKMKKIKRVRYGAKELQQLKSVITKAENEGADMSDVYKAVDKESLTKKEATADDAPSVVDKESPMNKEAATDDAPLVVDKESLTKKEASAGDAPPGEMEVDKPVRNYHKRKLTDEHGNYPPWMNQRAIKQHKKKLGKQKKRRGDKGIQKIGRGKNKKKKRSSL